MRVVLDVANQSPSTSALEQLRACLNHGEGAQPHHHIIVVCNAENADQALGWRQVIEQRTQGTALSVWQPSGIDAPEVDSCLLASFVSQLAPDLVVQLGEQALPIAPYLNTPTIRLASPQADAEVGATYDWSEVSARLQTISTNLAATDASATPHRLRLALLSPMPPARSGVADCSADLFDGLKAFYDITLIDTTPPEFRHWDDTERISQNIQSLSWFLEHADEFDRVVYQLGNSDYHAGMWPAMAKIPGVAALHDLFEGDYLSSEQERGYWQMWPEILVYEHGYKALARAHANHHDAVLNYPGNYRVFRDALGVVLHSSFAQALARQQVGTGIDLKTRVIPLVRRPVGTPSAAQKSAARQALGLGGEGTIVCSFGYIGASKLPLRLLEAWHASDLATDPHAQLIFVGRNHPGPLGQQVLDAIANLPNPEQVKITGFVDADDFTHYLNAADFAVQLRDFSRGETSGAVLHAMGHGLPQIVNANGSFAELDEHAVLKLPDRFTTEELAQAMNTLFHDTGARAAMAARAPEVIEQLHSPPVCARQYRDFIEHCYQHRLMTHPSSVLTTIARDWPDGSLSSDQRASLAAAIDFNRAASLPRRRLLLDLTTTYNTHMQTGIQRVALALFDELVDMEPEGLIVTPVYLSQTNGRWRYHQANQLMTDRLNLKEHWLTDHEILPQQGDILLTLDLSTYQLQAANQQGLFQALRAHGVHCYSIVYDLLPVTMPDKFPQHADQAHRQWLEVITGFDGALCISAHVADELARWRDAHPIESAPDAYEIGHFLLGADTETFRQQEQRQTPVHPPSAGSTARPPVFLMVGTIEPRKGYLETIRAFFELWQSGFDAHLIIVGREGWSHLPDHDRKDIPETVSLLRNHPERFRRLRWFDNADDAMLERAYARADCLIAASYDEGFGLPIIEATRHGVPVIARDIAVFREVAPLGTQFFKDGELADAIRRWQKPAHPPEDKHTITWRQSAQQVLQWLNDQRH
ncbi:glycosyltransferase [Orrella daihaiensis]|uniref:Glycosyltransferase n=1 Tax=Orrella daihaiensis TaxID=2782176 RepID=A0ABY4AJG4_9BURK|nr:glycosyltransferase [Orrella daihaiensis]UOD50431.1 glycosyltransferase [Orrella daihaiensis]